MNKIHYLHIVLFTLAFAVLLAIAICMYVNYDFVSTTPVNHNGNQVSKEKMEASMQKNAIIVSPTTETRLHKAIEKNSVELSSEDRIRMQQNMKKRAIPLSN